MTETLRNRGATALRSGFADMRTASGKGVRERSERMAPGGRISLLRFGTISPKRKRRTESTGFFVQSDLCGKKEPCGPTRMNLKPKPNKQNETDFVSRVRPWGHERPLDPRNAQRGQTPDEGADPLPEPDSRTQRALLLEHLLAVRTPQGRHGRRRQRGRGNHLDRYRHVGCRFRVSGRGRPDAGHALCVPRPAYGGGSRRIFRKGRSPQGSLRGYRYSGDELQQPLPALCHET